MANIINYLKHIRLTYRRSSNALKIFVAVVIVFGVVGLFLVRQAIDSTEAVNAALKEQAAQLEQHNTALQQNIDALGSVQSVEQIAQDELGLVDPDTVLIQPGD